ncbi:hypothetical protein PPTG_18539 [Phytophthora nicotianae INRA-310]|uniref:Uncharacterized protein n=1 Tax=Phytophthora nicotianae (strain INRA-310) TaxID=761204 RepID=W2PGF7_PHYN3|nr:hypothetical protein PPTG_18539 [Phytophthora nicotianae INRA-310]ETM99961.1 hypothetical protein PPTG_18539 [Phytophthora nicotianae INRA-310]
MATDDGNESSVLLLVLALAVEGRERKKKRQRGPNYLTRGDLHPHPRIGTACSKCNDISIAEVLTNIAGVNRWNATPVPMSDVNDVGDPRLDRRSLSPAAALSLMLHYLCSSMPEHSL